MRSKQVFIYAAGWAGLTVLAALAVWWGLRPLLSTGSLPAPSSASASSPSAVVLPSRSAVVPKPKPSNYDGWAYSNGTFLRTFEVTGGTATVRITGGKVELVSSTPRDGYTITGEQPAPQRLVLRFFKAGASSTIVDALWWENRPYAEVTVS